MSHQEIKPHFSVQPGWCLALPLQQQSVLLLATRGPDGVTKTHPCKTVHVAYRGCVLVAAKYGRALYFGESADSFMNLYVFADSDGWKIAVDAFLAHYDELAGHYVRHLLHGAEILAYHHPDERYRQRWMFFYTAVVQDMHLNVETCNQLDRRLSDWDRSQWDPIVLPVA